MSEPKTYPLKERPDNATYTHWEREAKESAAKRRQRKKEKKKERKV